MNTKKADWYNKPSFSNITLHSYSFINNGNSQVFFTIGEEDEITLSFKKEEAVNVSFILFHTPSDQIIFSDNKIKISLFGASLEVEAPNLTAELTLIKKGEVLEFYSSSHLILRTSNEVFIPSTTLSLRFEGEGEVEVTVI